MARFFQLPAPGSPKSFNAMAFMDEAKSAARRLFDDAVLTNFYVVQTRPTGLSDLTMGGSAMFSFRSKKASQSPPARCMAHVIVISNMLTVSEAPDEECGAALLGKPKCTVTQIWEKAIADGAPADKLASLYYMSVKGKSQWTFSQRDFSRPYEDDCK